MIKSSIFNNSILNISGRPITSTWAIAKSKFIEKLQQNGKDSEKDKDASKTVGEETTDKDDLIELNGTGKTESSNKKLGKNKKKLTPEERKELKLKKRKKRSRVILRNISFKV